ncbi:MAG: hypothetical protein DI630_30385, partial [Gordonia sp. (in: high G+C Gram-positive bacteria)]
MPETNGTDQDLVVAEFTLGNEDRPADEARTQPSFPMTAAQRGIWYAHQFDSEVPLSVSAYVELRGPVDLDVLADAVHKTARDTESALLRVIETDDEPVLTVDRDREVELGYVDLRDNPDAHAAALHWMKT